MKQAAAHESGQLKEGIHLEEEGEVCNLTMCFVRDLAACYTFRSRPGCFESVEVQSGRDIQRKGRSKCLAFDSFQRTSAAYFAPRKWFPLFVVYQRTSIVPKKYA